jgi:L-ascorbate metabolism protein UlaG (beta-lactamase superfamily)
MTIGILAAIIISMVTYMHTAEQFGASPEGSHLERIATSPQYRDGRFVNAGGVEIEMTLRGGLESLYEFITAKNTKPTHPLPTGFPANWDTAALPEDAYAVTWFGHSAVMVELQGQRLLIDPMLGPAASPLPVFGKRFALAQPIDLDAVPAVDAVLISHDHYDHLDHASILALSARVGHFYVPLGVGAHLRRWGVDAERITEMDWWQEVTFNGLRIAAAPAQHFSGRALGDRNKTLWASWVILGTHARIFFSGDSGYGPHFRAIGERYGPFDFTMMECGQYNEKWRPIHSMPEESVQGHIDLGGRVMMPIHWSGFTLAPHDWTEPVRRAREAAALHGVALVTPMIGQRFVSGAALPQEAWWHTAERSRRN